MFEVVRVGRQVPQFTELMLYLNDGQPVCDTSLQLKIISFGPILSIMIFLGRGNGSAHTILSVIAASKLGDTHLCCL